MKYLSENRPGLFKKSISVSTNIENEVTKLVVKGNVIGTPGKLRKRIGFLNSDTNRIDFKDVLYPNKVKQVIEIENPSKDKIDLSVLSSPEYISVKIDHETLKPGERGKLTVTFNSKKKEKYSSSTDYIRINIKAGLNNNPGTLTVIANVVEDFSKLTDKDLANAPTIFLPKNRFNTNELKLNELKKAEFNFENRGKSDLIIHNIEISNKLYKVQYFDQIIKPGEKGKIAVTVNQNKKTNNLKLNLTIISNDPKNSRVRMFVVDSMVNRDPKSFKTSMGGLNISSEETYKMIKEYEGSDKLIILDLRSENEFKLSHLPDAINMKYADCKKKINLFAKDKLYILYCELETESIMVAKLMQKENFGNVYYLEKGITGWEKMKLPLEK